MKCVHVELENENLESSQPTLKKSTEEIFEQKVPNIDVTSQWVSKYFLPSQFELSNKCSWKHGRFKTYRKTYILSPPPCDLICPRNPPDTTWRK